MGKLGHYDVISFLVAIGVMLIASRLAAELFKVFKMPVVLGEIIVGVVLGPTVLGFFAPDLFEAIFPFIAQPENTSHLPVQYAMDAIIGLSVIMLLFVAGLEVQMPLVIKQGKVAVTTTLSSMLIPIGMGFGAVFLFPDIFGLTEGTDGSILGFFLGVVLSITALPVIARILMDMKIFKTSIGMAIIASAMFIDMLGWLIFSVLLSMLDASGHGPGLWQTVVAVLVFGGFMLTIGSRLIDKALPWVQSKFSWPGGVLSISLGLCFLGAAFTESIGIHSILGAFIIGIALGDSANLREQTREIIHQFVTNVFSPLFFVSIGLYVNFIDNFNLPLVLMLLVLGYVSKIFGATLGARLGGLKKKDSLAVGMAMSTHGALEIILGSLAMEAGLINEAFFVAIVLMVVVSIITAAPLMKRFVSLPSESD